MSRAVSVAVVLAVIAASALILLHVILHAFGGHSQAGIVVYDGKVYDCHKVLRSIESAQGPGVYPQPVLDACVNDQTNGAQP